MDRVPRRRRIARRLLSAALLVAATASLTACGASNLPAVPASAIRGVATVASIKQIVLPPHPTVYFFGDSWTQGYAAAPHRGFPYIVGQALGWKVVVGPDESGAGYVNTFARAHPVFATRVKELPRLHADLVVIEGGVNDIPGPLAHFWTAAKMTVQQLQAKAGGAPVVIVGPATPDGTTPEGLAAIDYQLAGVAQQLRVPYISPIKEGWLNSTNVKGLIDPKRQHPNTAGHAYYGGRLAADLTRLIVQR
jgi:lysophospholipase L1-like esterase